MKNQVRESGKYCGDKKAAYRMPSPMKGGKKE
jgi:hypothetical protein